MKKRQEDGLKTAAANLTRADQDKNLQGMVSAHKMIKKVVAEIYKGRIDAPTVLGVEKILNQGQANVLGKSVAAYKNMEKLTGQAETGMAAYSVFEKKPDLYVEIAYASRTGVLTGRPFHNKIPYDPVRSALTEYRGQLAAELTQRIGNPFQDSLDANKTRFHATVTAERGYLEKILKYHDKETPEKKQEHLRDFDKKTAGLIRLVEPPQQAEKQPNRSNRSPVRSMRGVRIADEVRMTQSAE